MIPFHAMMEPLSESLLSSVFFSWSCEQFFTCNIFLVFIYRVLLWFLLDYILFRLIEVSVEKKRTLTQIIVSVLTSIKEVWVQYRLKSFF